MDEFAIKREIGRVLRAHQAQYNATGPTPVCTCNRMLNNTQMPGPIADHQADEVVAVLRQQGLLRPSERGELGRK